MFCFILLGKQGAPGYEGWPGPKGIQSKAGASGPFGGKGFPGSPGPSGRKVCTETAGNSTGEGSGEFRASQRRHSKSHKRCSFGGEGDAGIILGHLCFFTEHMVEMYCYQEILFS
ncbi:collagen alpha-1(I) chain-like isoform X2 [Carassius auratus]|uniref:Collagen alpha-1(I) chain-like isoform X2 n=1 Tax=Carassius auratus TaxID=7957 RepID=A0A6P6N8I8_CARAU|nr:collagen alpha-1(I) chain-like isoform X2 [Carassius auratus]